MELIQRAQDIAQMAHRNQKRMYSDHDYFIHCEAVADTLREYSLFDDEMIAAAYLHDVLEDTDLTERALNELFGPGVTNLVVELTDKFTKKLRPDLNRFKRKYNEACRLKTISPRAQTIKYADMIDNTFSIVNHDVEFAKVYIPEKRRILEFANRGWPELYYRAWQQLIVAETVLKS